MSKQVLKNFKFSDKQLKMLQRVIEGLEGRQARLMPSAGRITQTDAVMMSLAAMEKLLVQEGYLLEEQDLYLW